MKSSPAARKLRKEQTEAEKRLWWFLRNRQISNCKFRRQQAIGPYIVDLVCLEKKLIIELDGGQHAMQENKENDAARTAFLESEGYGIMRFWNNDVLVKTAGVLEVIQNALKAPSPHPLPTGEGTAL